MREKKCEYTKPVFFTQFSDESPFFLVMIRRKTTFFSPLLPIGSKGWNFKPTRLNCKHHFFFKSCFFWQFSSLKIISEPYSWNSYSSFSFAVCLWTIITLLNARAHSSRTFSVHCVPFEFFFLPYDHVRFEKKDEKTSSKQTPDHKLIVSLTFFFPYISSRWAADTQKAAIVYHSVNICVSLCAHD